MARIFLSPFINSLVFMTCLVSSTASIGAEAPAWLYVKEVSFQVVEPTKEYEVRIEFPALSALPVESTAFEYGTSYSFSLKRSEPVVIKYFEKGEHTRTAQMVGDLVAPSVLLAKDRAETPHYLEVSDEKIDVRYQIYISADKGPLYVKKAGTNKRIAILSHK